ncbi:MAG: hypothetical protein IKW80_00005, partial [Thermoguttaceae bacterium]|nr:hypothetical protein [Thermoguttaceae bacterium]
PVGCNGIAEAQLTKKTPSAGQTRIRTTLIRDNSDGKFTVPIRLAQGETVIDWGETGLLISSNGPTVVSGGMEAAYRITVSNVNTEQLSEIVVTNTVPESFEYQRSVPVGRVLDALVTNNDGSRSQKIQWTIPSLDSGQSQTFDVVYRTQNEGDFNVVSTAQAGDVQAEDVLHTRVIASGGNVGPQAPAPTASPNPLTGQNSDVNAELDIQIVCQDRANTGNNVAMRAYVTNNGSEAITQILSSVVFSPGLCSPFGESPVHLKPIEYIGPGKTRDVNLMFTATAPGRQNIVLELITQNGQRFNRQVFITVEGDACQPQCDNNVYPTAAENNSDQNSNSGLDSGAPALNNNTDGINNNQVTLNITAPAEAKAGEEIQVILEIGNYSNNDLYNLRLACFLDNNFEIVRNTTGLVTTNPHKPYWDILTPIPAKRGNRFILVVKAKSALPTFCNFVVQQGSNDVVKKECQIVIKKSENNEVVPETNLPDTTIVPDSPDPIPDVNVPEPDANLTTDLNVPSLDDPSLDIPSVEEPAANSLDDLSPELPNL